MRVIVTGQVGMDKKQYLEAVVNHAGAQGESVDLFNVGDLMYAEGKNVPPGRILDLPLSRLEALRRAALKDVIAESQGKPNILVNTHATFRWRHGLFSAFEFDQIEKLAPDVFVCLVDNIELVHHRLHRDHETDATLKDCMVWREEEILATEMLAQAFHKPFYIVSRGRHEMTTRTLFRLTCRPDMRKVYPSFPMSHVVDMPDVLAEIDAFRATLAERFVAFDPGDVDEKLLLDRAIEAARSGQDVITVEPHSFGGAKSTAHPIKVSVRQVLDIAGDIDGQIYMRDFKLIDQSDMIVSYIPELPGRQGDDGSPGKGIPGLSSGVERELQHAFEHAKDVYVVWKPAKAPSPFITETATRVFTSTDQALNHFSEQGLFVSAGLFEH